MSSASDLTARWVKWLEKHPQRQQQTAIADHSFHDQLKHHLQHVQVYENWDLQEKARSVIPIDQLHECARQSTDTLSFEDRVLKELLAWFKRDFFKWANEAPCESGCSSKTQYAGNGQPSAYELQHGAFRVELYKCLECFSINRFPRYGDPAILLEPQNRRGRCGEWANCFTLLCRAMGYETRYVVDWTDHVWTECWSESLQKFLHLDCCENAFDNPLLYESGWGKKLNYVIAFSADQVVDVTCRYTKDFLKEVIPRRTRLSEAELRYQINLLNQRIQSKLSAHKIEYISKRSFTEQLQLSWPSYVTGDEELPGRESGSLEWRMARSELGSASK